MTNKTDSPDLRPCPFCGGEAEIEQYGDRRQSTIYRCRNCSCSLETGEEWGHGADWNRRPDRSPAGEVQNLLAAVGDVLRMLDKCDPCGLRGDGDPYRFAKQTDWSGLGEAYRSVKAKAELSAPAPEREGLVDKIKALRPSEQDLHFFFGMCSGAYTCGFKDGIRAALAAYEERRGG